MYVRVYVCARTWGRSAAETLRHRLALFTQRGFFLLRDLLLLLVPFTAISALLRAAAFLAATSGGTGAWDSERVPWLRRCHRLGAS